MTENVQRVATDNRFLRRADVEALLDLKITAVDEKIKEARLLLGDPDLPMSRSKAVSADLIEWLAARGAMSVCRKQLDFCEQFTLAIANGEPTLLDTGNGVVEVA